MNGGLKDRAGGTLDEGIYLSLTTGKQKGARWTEAAQQKTLMQS